MNYAQECLDLDKKLAELLWPIETQHVYNSAGDVIASCGIWHPVRDSKECPRWTQDDAEAFRLAVEYEIDIRTMSIGVECQDADCNKSYVVLLWGSFPNKLAAVRFAIVKAVVNKLQGENWTREDELEQACFDRWEN